MVFCRENSVCEAEPEKSKKPYIRPAYRTAVIFIGRLTIVSMFFHSHLDIIPAEKRECCLIYSFSAAGMLFRIPSAFYLLHSLVKRFVEHPAFFLRRRVLPAVFVLELNDINFIILYQSVDGGGRGQCATTRGCTNRRRSAYKRIRRFSSAQPS